MLVTYTIVFAAELNNMASLREWVYQQPIAVGSRRKGLIGPQKRGHTSEHAKALYRSEAILL